MFRSLPGFRDRGSQIGCRGEPSAARSIRADEVGVAELADRAVPVAFVPGPQVATGEPAEHRRTPSVSALALQRVEDLLDSVHGQLTDTSAGSLRPRADAPVQVFQADPYQ
jgi:hypothetical protein